MNFKTNQVRTSDIIKSALKFFSGEETNVCRLCFTTASETDSVSVEISITLERYYYSGTVSFSDILQDIGVTQEYALPKVICMNCALQVINSFLFQNFCQYSNNKWNNLLENFYKTVPKLENLNRVSKSLYLLAYNDDEPWVSSSKPLQEKTKQFAAMQLRNVIVNKKKRDKKKQCKTCKECSIIFEDSKKLREHVNIVHIKEYKKLNCPKCHRVFQKRYLLLNHVERRHTSKNVPCSYCNKKFGTLRILEQHTKFLHKSTNCSLCSVELPSKYALLKHSMLHAKMKCPNCYKVFTSQNGFSNHVLNICGEMKSESFYCDICNKSFLRKNGVRNHLKVEHGFGKVHPCSYCSKKFAAISSLNQHIVKHTKEKKFSCEQCGGLFVTLAALTYHTRIHTGERPYPCEICGERFLSSSRRMAHKHSKHLGPHKQCSLCPRKFITKFQLDKHVGRHYNPQSKLYIPHQKKVDQCLLDM